MMIHLLTFQGSTGDIGAEGEPGERGVKVMYIMPFLFYVSWYFDTILYFKMLFSFREVKENWAQKV